MNSTTQVHPFIGAGDLRLGMTRAQVEAFAGKPDEVWESGEADGERREIWEYHGPGWSLDFDEEDGWRLVGVDLYAPLLDGLELSGLDEEEALAAWAAAGLPPLEEDDGLRDIGTGIFRCDALQLVLWTGDGMFEYLTVGPRWSEDGESILWPDA